MSTLKEEVLVDHVDEESISKDSDIADNC